MKLITYEEFCRMPAGTIFAPYQPCVLDECLSIKVDGGNENGWFNGVMPLEPWNVEEIWAERECPVSFETYDGANADYMDYDQILVFDEVDVDRMIDILKWAKKGCVGEPEGCPEGCPEGRTDDVFDKMKYFKIVHKATGTVMCWGDHPADSSIDDIIEIYGEEEYAAEYITKEEYEAIEVEMEGE